MVASAITTDADSRRRSVWLLVRNSSCRRQHVGRVRYSLGKCIAISHFPQQLYNSCQNPYNAPGMAVLFLVVVLLLLPTGCVPRKVKGSASSTTVAGLLLSSGEPAGG